MDLSHEGLVSERTVTKRFVPLLLHIRVLSLMPHRDMFYQDVKLFQTQSTVNNVTPELFLWTATDADIGQLVDDLAATCGIRRRDLNIVRRGTF